MPPLHHAIGNPLLALCELNAAFGYPICPRGGLVLECVILAYSVPIGALKVVEEPWY